MIKEITMYRPRKQDYCKYLNDLIDWSTFDINAYSIDNDKYIDHLESNYNIEDKLKNGKFDYPLLTLDIEVYAKWGDDVWPQANYLAHGWDGETLWTNSIDDAVNFLKRQLETTDNSLI